MIEVLLRFLIGNYVAVHSLAGTGFKIQSAKPKEPIAPRILRRHCINAKAKQRLRCILIEFDDLRINVCDIGQIMRVAHSRQSRFLVVGPKPAEIIGAVTQRHKVTLGRFRERSVCKKTFPYLLPLRCVVAFVGRAPDRQGIHGEHVGTKCLFVEEDAWNEAARRIDLSRNVFLETWNIDAQLLDQALGNWAIRRRTLDREGPAITKQLAIANRKLIALRVSAEVVVIFYDQNARIRIRLTKKISG